MKYMLIIDKVIQQIVIQKDGEDGDPASALADLDMRAMIAELTGGSNYKENEDKYKKQVDKNKRLEREMNTLREVMENEKNKMKNDLQEQLNSKIEALFGSKKVIQELELILTEKGIPIPSRASDSGVSSIPPPPPFAMGAPPPPPPPMPGMPGKLCCHKL